MRLQASTSGTRPRDLISAMKLRTEQAVTLGMKGVAAGLLVDMRAEIAAAFPESRRLPTTITGRAYPDRAGAFSLSASALVRARSPSAAKILNGHEGNTIRAKGGRFLAVPTKEVPRGRYNARLTPRDVEQRFGAKLEFLPRGKLGPKQRTAVLILRGERVRAARSKGRTASVRTATRQVRRLKVMFLLVASVTLRKRLAPEQLGAAWAARAPDFMRAAYDQLSRER